MIVNILCSLEEILKLHQTSIKKILIAEVPRDAMRSHSLANMYDGLYPNLMASIYRIEKNKCPIEEDRVMIVMRCFADESLQNLVPVKDDEICFFEGDMLVDLVTNDIHFICRSTKKDLIDCFQRFNLPCDF